MNNIKLPPKNSHLFSVTLRKGMNAFAFIGAALFAYGFLGVILGFSLSEFESILLPFSYVMSILGVLVTCLTVYMKNVNLHPPERFSLWVSAPITIIGCIFSICWLTYYKTLPDVSINGLVMIGFAGAFFRIQPATH